MLNRLFKSTTATVKFILSRPVAEHAKIREVQTAFQTLNTLENAKNGSRQHTVDDAMTTLTHWRELQKSMRSTLTDRELNAKRDALKQLASKLDNAKLLMIASSVISTTSLLFLFLLNENYPSSDFALQNVARVGLVSTLTTFNVFFHGAKRFFINERQIVKTEEEAVDQAMVSWSKKMI